MFDEKLCEQGRNFTNKLWNAFRLVKGWETDEALKTTELDTLALDWFRSKMNEALAESNDLFTKFRISDALHVIYKLVWDDFCSFFLEMIKPTYGQPISSEVLAKTLDLFDALLRFTHPFMPFISEEIWQQLKERKDGESICVSPYPSDIQVDQVLMDQVSVLVEEMLIPLRNHRNSNQISPKTAIEGLTISSRQNWATAYLPLISKLGNVADYSFRDSLSGYVFAGKRLEWALPKEERALSSDEKTKLVEELNYTKGFLEQVNQKLANERFVANAKPEMVEKERQKKADAEAKIAGLEKVLG